MQTRSLAISLITEGPFIGIIGALQRTITVAPPLHLWDQQSSASMTEESRVVTAGRRVVAADWPGRSNRSSWRAQTDDRSQDCRPVTCLMDCNYHQVMHFCWNRWYGFYQLSTKWVISQISQPSKRGFGHLQVKGHLDRAGFFWGKSQSLRASLNTPIHRATPQVHCKSYCVRWSNKILV